MGVFDFLTKYTVIETGGVYGIFQEQMYKRNNRNDCGDPI